MNVLGDITLRTSLVIVAALAATLALKRRSAALRHWVLAIGICCAAAVPVFQEALPMWPMGAMLREGAEGSRTRVPASFEVRTARTAQPDTVRLAERRATPGAVTPRSGLSLVRIVLGVWLTGVLLGVFTLIVGFRRLSRIASAARPVTQGPLSAVGAELRQAMGIRRTVLLLRGEDPALLMTWGAARPTVLLPAAAERWSEERARVVLRHEFAHIMRGDWLAQCLAESLRIVYWFNPLVWIACARLRVESEHACDDFVLNSGIAAPDYASHLVAIARTAAARPTVPVLAMARSSSLEGRISAMLNARINRRPLRHATRIATLVAFVSVAVPLAIAQARFSSLSGTALDPTNRLVPEVTLILTNSRTQAKYEVRTDGAGHFEFVGLPAGDYQLAVQKPGFKTLKESVSVAGKDLTRALHLQMASVMETIHVTSGPAETATSDAERQAKHDRAQQRADDARRRATESCSGAAATNDTGGRIIAPLKLVDVKPAYSDSLKAAGVAGEVVLDAVIGVDGTVRDVTVVSSPSPDLERLAGDAVRQWRFSPTYLNCTPVEVSMRVSVTFSAQ